ncbi:MAG: serine/threonine protein kinase [Halobacteriales archaeon]|nr:serine/threonine protein kinase [Halobacteriales archaeon]
MALALDEVLVGMDVLVFAGMWALAALLLRLDFASRVHRTFALYLVVRGTFQGIQVVQAFLPGFADWGNRVGGYYSLAVPFALLAVAAALFAERGGKPGAARLVAPVLLLGAAAEAWYALDHTAYRAFVDGTFVAGPLYPLAGFRLFAAAAIGAGLLLAASRQAAGSARMGLQVVGIAFLLEPVEVGVGELVPRIAPGSPLPAAGPGPNAVWPQLAGQFTAAGLLVALVAAWFLLQEARRGPAPRVGSAGLVLVAGAALAWFVSPAGGFVIAALAIPLLVTYALVRHRFLDIDLQLKRSVRVGTVAVVFVVAYLIVGLTVRSVLPPQEGELVAFVGPAALLLFIGPLQRVGGQVADAVFPGVEPTEAYLRERRREVYAAALEHALDAGGEVRASQAARLATLRAQLRLAEAEHAEALALARASAARVTLVAGGVFLDRYHVVRPLGRGSSGEVWLARDAAHARDVAIKRLTGERGRDAEALRRFRREADLASSVRHPNVVAVHGVEEAGEDVYLVMEYAPGGSLAERLKAGPMGEAEALAVARDVLAGLAAFHAQGLVHRDVKPSNVLRDAAGNAKLCDFSLAREAVSGATVAASAHAGRGDGTLAYMAPEQARGEAVTARSDLYGAGATLYEMLAGHAPIGVEGLSEFEARLRVTRDPPKLPILDVSPATNAVLARALAKDPRRRFATAGEMADALVTRAGTRAGSGRRR